MSPVVHITAASLRTDVEAAAIDAAVEYARGLASAPGAGRALVARSESAVLTATWLAGHEALEPFAASPAHMAFVMRGLAPSVTGIWSAGVETDTPPPADAVKGLLWVFGVRDSDSVYEWQIRDMLDSLASLPALVAAGPTFEERDRYRAAGIARVATADIEAFRAALDGLRAGWGEIVRHVVEASADLVAP